MPFTNPQERTIAVKVLAAVRSDKYKGKNFLFQLPFALDQVPGYLEEVGKPLDLQTIEQNLKNGVYDDDPRAFFWDDLHAVFQNAITYHANRETKWIAKFAKDMLKVVAKERKKAEDPVAGKKLAPKMKLKLMSSPESVSSNITSTASSAFAASDRTEEASSQQPKKPKLKLKLSAKTSGLSSKSLLSESSASAESTPPQAKPPPVTSSTTAPTEKVVPKKAKPTQPKLKLKLSLNKKKNEMGIKAAKAAVGTSKQLPKPVDLTMPAPSVVKVSAPAGPRGKELPQGVAQPTSTKATKVTSKASANNKTKKPNNKKSTTTGAAPVVPSTTPSSAASSVLAAGSSSNKASNSAGNARLDATQKKQCAKVLMGLKRRRQKQVAWFLSPVSDKAILADYKAKIKHPVDLSTIQSKLDKGHYKRLDAFVLDLRRVVANALRYNTSIKDSPRPLAIEVLEMGEMLLQMFVARFYPQSYQPLLYCWKVCIDIMNTLYNLTNPNDGQPMALYFMYPVSYYCGGQFPPDYLERVKNPMDFGTITANLVEGRYQSVDAFASDCRLVIQNCQTYYHGREDGRIFVDQALRLEECLSTSLGQLARYDKSTKGASERQKALELVQHPGNILQQRVLPNQPPSALLQSVIDELRTLKYTDKGTKITEPALGPFEKPVSLVTFPDYAQHVSEPMDLQSVERKIKAGNVYETPEDFEYDMTLIFKNCEVYNANRNAQHPVSMAKFAMRKFRTIFHAKMGAFEDPAASPPKQPDRAVSSVQTDSGGSQPPPNKKLKIDLSSVGAAAAGGKGKTVPRISITAAQISSATSAAQRIKPPPLPKSSSNITNKASSSQPSTPKAAKPLAPVPLHVAIAKVKEAFPLRRQVKSLQSWEADCARYFKELMRHPWVSTTRPKFIFHVPVPILFPDLKEVYAYKIRKPMDLTTIECTLLAGNRYTSCEDFLQDVALCFANAIRFNKDGRDLGDPLSCAYYDASVHLLRYSRWLSLELLSGHIAPASEHIKDESGPDGLPPFQWRLTEGNRRLARHEQESIVLNEPLEKSLEGDRYTWMEAECEKLLKALRHQSDLKWMTFFLSPNYPADYAAFISRPMDWEKVSRTLKKRHYDTIGAMIDDLRLIFINAEKYNARYKGTDSVSGRAYEAARIMSFKLETAISKMLLSVGDRLERERIDHSNAEREIEAAERVEEAQIRATWKKQGEAEAGAPLLAQGGRGDLTQRSRNVRIMPQRNATDFEIPFFDDEDDGHHEQSHFELIKYQKERFEKQRLELSKMRQKSAAIGASVLSRLLERRLASKRQEQPVTATTANPTTTASKSSEEASDSKILALDQPSAILGELEKEGRKPLQISLNFAKKKAPKRKRGLTEF